MSEEKPFDRLAELDRLYGRCGPKRVKFKRRRKVEAIKRRRALKRHLRKARKK